MSRNHASGALLLAALAGQAMSVRAQAQSTEPFAAQFELSSLLPINGGDGSNGFVLTGSTGYQPGGIDIGGWFGFSVSSGGDINGDGFDELIIGAPNYDVYDDWGSGYGSGVSYLVFGRADVAPRGVLDFEYFQLFSTGIFLQGPSPSNNFGRSVSSAGDVNGDGYDDLIIGALSSSPDGISNAGQSYVIFGAPGDGSGGAIELSSLDGTTGFVINGIDSDDHSGGSVCSAGDVNGDGIDDLIIGAFRADPNGVSNAGESYVVFGDTGVGSSGVLELSSLDGTNGFVLNGIDADDYSGFDVCSPGDVNGDGIDDLIIGAYRADPNGFSDASESYVVFGGPGVGSSGVLGLSSLDGTNGFVLNGIDADDYSGFGVSAAGDMNGDGIDDLIIGAIRADPNGLSNAGESYVVFGGTGVGGGGVLELSALNGTNGFVLNGIDTDDYSGFDVSSAGDVNGDGIEDLIIGAFRADPNGVSNAGESYVVYGGMGVGSSGAFELSSLDGSNGFLLNGIDTDDYSGVSVCSAGDVNGDGIEDLIIGAIGADQTGGRGEVVGRAGESYVVFGRDLAPCASDLNNDGFVDAGDINVFIALYLAGDLTVDFNNDGFVDSGDVGEFVSLFLAGC